jgi:hypothetical protein
MTRSILAGVALVGLALAPVFVEANTATRMTSAAYQTQSQTLAPVGTPDIGRIVSVVSSIPLAVDLARYDLAEAAFAPRIVIDYTSLWGGQPATMTPAELMTAWRGIVPGFDATFHELSNVRATVNGDRATATAFVDGRHWIGERLWRPVGDYHWTLERIGGEWKVTSMTFAMTREIGDRDVAAEASRRAAARRS